MGVKAAIVCGLSLSLAGCGVIAAKKQQEHVASVKEQVASILSDCDTKYQKVRGQLVNRTRCRSEAFNLYKTITPYPDLVDQEVAFLMVDAEKVDAGKITLAQAELDASQLHSQLVSEEQRRMLSSRSVGAQESAAAAAWQASAPVTCSRIGNTTTCY